MSMHEEILPSIRKAVEKTLFNDMKNKCNVNTCRYNQDGKCTNEDKRKECVEVSRKVLCLEEKK